MANHCNYLIVKIGPYNEKMQLETWKGAELASPRSSLRQTGWAYATQYVATSYT